MVSPISLLRYILLLTRKKLIRLIRNRSVGRLDPVSSEKSSRTNRVFASEGSCFRRWEFRSMPGSRFESNNSLLQSRAVEFVATMFQFILRNGRAVRRTSAGHVSFPLCLVRLFCSFPACSVSLLIGQKKREKRRKKMNEETKEKKKKEQRKTNE